MILKLNIKEFVGLNKSDNTPVFETKNINSDLLMSVLIGDTKEFSKSFSLENGNKHSTNIADCICYSDNYDYYANSAITNSGEIVFIKNISVNNGVVSITIPNLKVNDFIKVSLSIETIDDSESYFKITTFNSNTFNVYGYDTEVNVVVKSEDADPEIDPEVIDTTIKYADWSIIEIPFENKINVFFITNQLFYATYRKAIESYSFSYSNTNNISNITENVQYTFWNNYHSLFVRNFVKKEYYPTITSKVNSYETDIKYIQTQDIIVSTEIDYSNVATYIQDEIEVFPNEYGKLTVRNKESNDEIATIVKSDVNNKVISVISVLPAYGDIHDIIEINTKFDSFYEYQFVESSKIKKGFYKLFNYVNYNVLEDNITKGFQLTLYNKYVYIEFYGNETIDLQDKEIKLIELDSVNVYNPCCLNDDQVYMVENKGSNQDVDNGDMFLGSFPVQGGNSFLASKVFATNSIISSFYAEGDLPYRIEQKNCNKIDFTNNSNQYDLLVSVYRMLEDSSSFDEEADIEEIIEKETKTLSLFEGTNIYKIEIRFKSRDEILSEKDDIVVHYFVLKCDFTECLLKYTNELICCDTTNCDSSIDCRCVEKQYYNFNAFMTLAHTVVAMMNDIYIDSEMFRFLLTQEEINEKVKKLYDLRTILNRAKEYCLDCETIKSNSTPCKGC